MSRAGNFDESQIPETTGGLVMQTHYMQCSYLIQYAIRLNKLGGFGVLQLAALHQE